MASILNEAFNVTTTAIVKYNNTNDKLVIPNNANVATSWLSTGRIQIPLYATILLLAIVGNSLVILTLVQNRRMRTITNVFLLNLAVSDILLGVLCMPFTLIGTLLRDFVFGEVMCKLLPYLQGKYYKIISISGEKCSAYVHCSIRAISHDMREYAYLMRAWDAKITLG